MQQHLDPLADAIGPVSAQAGRPILYIELGVLITSSLIHCVCLNSGYDFNAIIVHSGYKREFHSIYLYTSGHK